MPRVWLKLLQPDMLCIWPQIHRGEFGSKYPFGSKNVHWWMRMDKSPGFISMKSIKIISHCCVPYWVLKSFKNCVWFKVRCWGKCSNINFWFKNLVFDLFCIRWDDFGIEGTLVCKNRWTIIESGECVVCGDGLWEIICKGEWFYEEVGEHKS